MSIITSTRNSIATAGNEFQGTDKRVLCVCSAGCLRPPTLANVLHKNLGYNTRSAGSHESFAIIPVSEALLHWADEVVFVNLENYKETFGGSPLSDVLNKYHIESVHVLSVPDNFAYMDAELVDILSLQYSQSVPVLCDGEPVPRY